MPIHRSHIHELLSTVQVHGVTDDTSEEMTGALSPGEMETRRRDDCIVDEGQLSSEISW